MSDDLLRVEVGGTRLSRHDCPTCGPNTLYRSGSCIHCGESLPASQARFASDRDRLRALGLLPRNRH